MPLPTEVDPRATGRVETPADDGVPRHAYPPRLAALTPLRFVAAALIAAGHGADRLGFALGAAWPLRDRQRSLVLLRAVGLRARVQLRVAFEPGAPTRRYLVMRFARIWPMHLVGLIAILVAFPRAAWALPGIDASIAAALFVTLTQTWFTLIAGYAGAYNPPAWTLSVDVFCYLAFPWLLLRTAHGARATSPSRSGASIACPIAATVLGPSNTGDR